MVIEQSIIEFLQRLRSPFWDGFFTLITYMGDELVFIAVCIALYWCYDKRYALLFSFNFFTAAISVDLIKKLVMRERPYHVNPALGVGELTNGYSFPSGHTQSAASMATALAIKFSRRGNRALLTTLSVVWVVLVGVSRMYLGQHYLTDVLAGGLLGVLISVILFYGFSHLLKSREEIVLWIMVPVVIALMVVFRNDYQEHRNFFIAGGAVLSVAIGFITEKRYINYNVRQELWYIQILKVIIGGSVAIAIKEGFKALFAATGFNPYLADFLRYFALGMWVSLGAPALFKYGLGALKQVKSHQ